MVGKLDMANLGRPCGGCLARDEKIKTLQRASSRSVGRAGGLTRENKRLRKIIKAKCTACKKKHDFDGCYLAPGGCALQGIGG
jgi:hypothetical protein